MATLSILPTTVDITVQQETDQTIEFQLTDGTSPINITADTVKFTMRNKFGSTAVLVSLTNAPGAHAAPTLGKTRFALTRTILTAPTRDQSVTYVYEVRRIIAGTGEQVVYVQGKITLKPVVGL